MSSRWITLAAVLGALAAAPSGAGDPGTAPPDEPGPHQRESKSPPPAAPGAVRIDPGAPLPPPPSVAGPPEHRVRRVQEGQTPAAAPGQFNPDPGAWLPATVPEESPYFSTYVIPEPTTLLAPPPAPAPQVPLVRAVIEPVPPAAPDSGYGLEPLPDPLRLPRARVRENLFIPQLWTAATNPAPTDASGPFPGSKPVTDRWRISFMPWRRYTSGDTDEMPYYHSDPEFWHYYRQSLLKGDLPIRGQDVFLRLTASASIVAEDRSLPVPHSDSAAKAGGFDFFGSSASHLFTSDFALEADLFRGDTAFKPADWLIRIKPVFDFNHVDFRETEEVSPSPRGTLAPGIGGPPDNGDVTNPGDVGSVLSGGLAPAPVSLVNTDATARNEAYVSLEEAFVEKHLMDLSPNYDFCAVALGNQTFNSDFRGFIFNDTNLGARFFGNYDSNRWQYNAAVFDLREKDTNSGLNTFQRRGDVVAVANVYRQDTFVPGYTTELSVLASFDQGDPHYDTNGFLVRPAPIGAVRPHRVDSFYLGWTGDGHLGRWNVSDALYGVTGRDDFNGIAGRPVDILAEMAALELSYDRDWIRYKASFFFASGDHNVREGRATGFDSIEDNVNFTGGPFSYWVRQSFNLAGTSVPLKQRFSLLPDLRAGGNFEGQANFVNPGLILYGVGAEADLTPKLRAFANANYLFFDTVEPLKTILLTNQAGTNIGTDLSLGVQWRPFLISNVVISAGCGVLLPANGYRDIYANTEPPVPGFTSNSTGGKVDDFLYSAILAATFTY
jgi:hypothetical protein